MLASYKQTCTNITLIISQLKCDRRSRLQLIPYLVLRAEAWRTANGITRSHASTFRLVVNVCWIVLHMLDCITHAYWKAKMDEA